MPRGSPGRALVVTTSRSRGVLAAVRALHGAGWDVGVGTPDGSGMVAASRWARRSHVVPRPRGDGDGFVSGVRAAVDEAGYDLVFGGGDDWMAALATYRDAIPTAVAHPDADVVASAIDKVELARRGAAAGFAVPRTEPATAAVLERWDGPLVVKCEAHWHPGQEHRYRIEARRFESVDAARGRLQQIEAAGVAPVVQEPVDGRLGALIGLFDGTRLLGRVQQETHRLWPTPSGVSCRAETVEVDHELVARAERLLADLGWTGLVELQHLTDGDGVRHLIDLNGRFYGSMALALAAGTNLPDAWARQVLGQPLPDLPDGRPGVRFTWGAGDLRRAVAERRGGLWADVVDTLRWARRAHTSVWDVRDPGPTLHLLTARFRRPGREAAA